MGLEIRPLSPVIGAELTGVTLHEIDNATFDRLRQALLRHQVVFVRGQDLSPPSQRALAQRFGPPLLHPAYPTLADAVTVLESTPEAPSKIDTWHSDMTFEARPPMGSILHARIIPPCGGDTQWANMCAAYDRLSPAMQSFVSGLDAVHDFRHGFAESLREPGGWERLRDAIKARPPVTHPAVRTHPETGQKALFVNRLFTTGFVQLSRAEGDALLAFLCDHAVMPEHTVRWRWRVGDVAIWDNRCTQHRPINDYVGHRRLHRVTIQGGAPR